MTKKPWIGIPTRYNEKTDTIGQNRHYLDAVLWAGGLPLLIPTVNPPVVREYVDRLDGILLPGSSTDVDPAFYGATPHPKLGKGSPERDATDFALLEYGEKAALPVFGICFGVQSLNVYRGGKLVQDIPSVIPQPVPHDNPEPPARHVVRLNEGSRLARLAGATTAEVNSYHHQSVETPGRDLRVVATAPDGVIEGVEDTAGRFIIGVQWHPEREWRTDPFARALFAAFIEEAGKTRRA
jgi:putative glutamine amidotransferase